MACGRKGVKYAWGGRGREGPPTLERTHDQPTCKKNDSLRAAAVTAAAAAAVECGVAGLLQRRERKLTACVPPAPRAQQPHMYHAFTTAQVRQIARSPFGGVHFRLVGQRPARPTMAVV